MNRVLPELFGGIEAGGTKFVCAIAHAPDRILARARFQTGDPQSTLENVVAFFRQHEPQFGRLQAVGIGSFGPVDIDPASPNYGTITTTPKPLWSRVNLVKELKSALQCDLLIDTDVNCALLGEHTYGAAQDCSDAVYLTIGTGIGGGLLTNGKCVFGRGHPEIGHLFVPKDPRDRNFVGVCPYHGDLCFEGLASGPSIEKRWGARSTDLGKDHEAWDLEARYIGILCHNLLMTTAPEKIILGGGVMNQELLIDKVRCELNAISSGYGIAATPPSQLNNLLLRPELGSDAGVIGALQLAKKSCASATVPRFAK